MRQSKRRNEVLEVLEEEEEEACCRCSNRSACRMLMNRSIREW